MQDVFDIASLSPIEVALLIDELKDLDPYVEQKVNYVVSKASVDINTALEYVINDTPALWAKVFVNWTARDYQLPILDQGKKAKRLVLRLGRRLGKCLTGDTKIFNPDTGELFTINKLIETHYASKYSVYSLNKDLKLATCKDIAISYNGPKETYRLTTNSGKYIDCTDNHPFLTLDGWKELSELSIGDHIATPRKLECNGTHDIEDHVLKYLGYMIGDGCFTTNNLTFTKSINVMVEEMREIVSIFNCKLVRYSKTKPDYRIIPNIPRSSNGALECLKGYGLFGKYSHQKTIPDELFKLPNSKLAIFLSRLFSTDGWIYSGIDRRTGLELHEIGYSSTSKEMIHQIQHLLLRFGIHCTIRTRYPKKSPNRKICYSIYIRSKNDIKIFCEEIGVFGRQEKQKKIYSDIMKMSTWHDDYIPKEICGKIIKKCKEKKILSSTLNAIENTRTCRYKKARIQRFALRQYAEQLDDNELRALASSDIYWEKIKYIEKLGVNDTYDLSVSDTKNFVANDIITHNTEDMCILILWHAFRQPNKKPNESAYNILILTPYETQIDLIFDRLNQLIEGSSILKGMLKRPIQHRLEFDNGTIIRGITLGVKSGSQGASTRGQPADLLVLDEIDYADSKTLTNVMNIPNEDPGRIKVVASSTPCGKHEEFYRWCTGAKLTLRPKQEDIENFKFTGYVEDKKEKGGNAWTQVYAPSTVSKAIIEVNPDTQQTYLQDIKDELTEMRYEQEVMAEFGEEEMGVYKKKFIYRALDLGRDCNHKYVDEMNPAEKQHFFNNRHNQILIAAIDWDAAQATPNILGLCFDKVHRNSVNVVEPIFKVIFRVDIPRTEFLMDSAVNKVIELNNIYDFDWIAADRGFGDVQIEMLKKYGTEHPETNLHTKVIGVHLGSTLEVRDPHTRKKEKKNIKPFMVNNSVLVFERNKIILNERDKILTRQLENYKVVRYSQNRTPIYIDVDEHSVDTLNLALLTFEQKYGELFKNLTKMTIGSVKIDNNIKENWNVNRHLVKDEELKSIRGFSNKKVIDVTGVTRTNSQIKLNAPGSFRRGGF